jgi:hypothetical protein
VNTYRVDRNNQIKAPCGMNSIIYIGDNASAARKQYERTVPGKDWWGQDNDSYGVILSLWRNGEYAPQTWKFNEG